MRVEFAWISAAFLFVFSGTSSSSIRMEEYESRLGHRLQSSETKNLIQNTPQSYGYYSNQDGYYKTFYDKYYEYAASQEYLNRTEPSGDVYVCLNYDVQDENGTILGIFTCPLPFEPKYHEFCCGPTYAEFCCTQHTSIEDHGTNSKKDKILRIVTYVAAAIGALFLISTVCACIHVKCSQRRPKTAPFPSEIPASTPGLYATKNLRSNSNTTMQPHEANPGCSAAAGDWNVPSPPVYDDVTASSKSRVQMRRERIRQNQMNNGIIEC
ncbi:hypothetical protein CAPTEDRAFT_212842 [Capitella teleta]|uniref:Shisa N-terminal domain-containing protein n=1 Tax=Capitella teleta TaxID=283909 RepID=R7UY44_CAPTE|nr:hypothetical protein CAPTEDRAFT_212842 [Capitella teleta]|eukprot:ELU11219.1 hypothetical protein CAPTEDRAFT_212842 [Capitella teleta]